MKKRKPVILFLFNRLGMGGVTKSIAFVANICAEAGYDVRVISLSSNKQTITLNKDIKIHTIGYEGEEVYKYSRLKKYYHLIKMYITLFKLVKSNSPDLVVAFRTDIVRVAVKIAKRMGIPVIGSVRGNPKEFTRRQMEKYTKNFNKCDVIVFQTENAMKCFNNTIQKKGIVIPNPSIPRLKTIEPFIGERKKIIMTCGRLAEEKQFDILIKAFDKVYHRYPDYRLHIYGDGPEKDYLKKLINDYGLYEAVFLMGHYDDVFANAYNNAIFVLSSRTEGMPNALIEAMSIGIPSISTDCEPGGPRILMADGLRGLLVPVGDINALSDAICSYIENPEIACQYGKVGMEINNELSQEVISGKWLEIINKCIHLSRKNV